LLERSEKINFENMLIFLGEVKIRRGEGEGDCQTSRKSRIDSLLGEAEFY
jgi:hypothetical protein